MSRRPNRRSELQLPDQPAGGWLRLLVRELDDDVRAGVIKRAHNLNACLIEFHTHPMPGGACFSPSDIKGLKELAPQLLWRLKKRPYVAVVVAPDGLDALAWTSEGVRQVDGILVDARPLLPASRRTLTTRYAP